jgi:GH24 family phage-related lysozyme (muramidase)
VQVRVTGIHNPDATILPTIDLPWFIVMNSSESAGMSGIGSSSGLLPGSTVAVGWLDGHEKQMGIVIGSICGIPQQHPFINTGVDNISVIGGSSAPVPENPIPTPSAPALPTTVPVSASTLSTLGVANPASMTISVDGVSLLKTFESFRGVAYQDSTGIWTIGYGSTTVAGAAVVENQTITIQNATAELMNHLQQYVVPTIQRVTIPLTQQMFDACCSLAYNIGTSAFHGSTLNHVQNSGDYASAAEHFLDWDEAGGRVIPGLQNRRAKEKAYYLSGGIPDKVTGMAAPAPASNNTNSSGAFVVGATTSPKQLLIHSGQTTGFRDPSGKFPMYYNEPDTSRLARGQQLGATILFKKRTMRVIGVPQTPDGVTWNQPDIPYSAQYPYNKVRQSESGHVMEIDDTPSNERLHTWHTAGTFDEIDRNGSKTSRIVGDSYEIIDRNGFIYIKGDCNVTIMGNSSVYTVGNSSVYTDGNATIECRGDMTTNVSGTYSVRAQSISMESVNDTNILSHGNLNTQAASNISMLAGGTASIDGASISLDGGTSVPATGTGLNALSASGNVASSIPTITAPTMQSSMMSQYDEPDAGDSTAYTNTQIANGNISATVLTSTSTVGTPTSTSTITSQPAGVVVDTSALVGLSTFPPTLQVSPNCTLSKYTAHGTRQIIPQFGLSAHQIVKNISYHANNVFEQVLQLYPSVLITSGFRTPAEVPQSAAHSQHYLGQAADFYFPNAGSRQGLHDIAAQLINVVPFDQFLLESSGNDVGWIHISYVDSSVGRNRGQILTMHNSKTVAQGLAVVSS